jgi:hypothetical protein
MDMYRGMPKRASGSGVYYFLQHRGTLGSNRGTMGVCFKCHVGLMKSSCHVGHVTWHVGPVTWHVESCYINFSIKASCEFRIKVRFLGDFRE